MDLMRISYYQKVRIRVAAGHSHGLSWCGEEGKTPAFDASSHPHASARSERPYKQRVDNSRVAVDCPPLLLFCRSAPVLDGCSRDPSIVSANRMPMGSRHQTKKV